MPRDCVLKDMPIGCQKKGRSIVCDRPADFVCKDKVGNTPAFTDNISNEYITLLKDIRMDLKPYIQSKGDGAPPSWIGIAQKNFNKINTVLQSGFYGTEGIHKMGGKRRKIGNKSKKQSRRYVTATRRRVR